MSRGDGQIGRKKRKSCRKGKRRVTSPVTRPGYKHSRGKAVLYGGRIEGEDRVHLVRGEAPKAVVRFLRERLTELYEPKELARLLRMQYNTVKLACWRLANQGVLRKEAGAYGINDPRLMFAAEDADVGLHGLHLRSPPENRVSVTTRGIGAESVTRTRRGEIDENDTFSHAHPEADFENPSLPAGARKFIRWWGENRKLTVISNKDGSLDVYLAASKRPVMIARETESLDSFLEGVFTVYGHSYTSGLIRVANIGFNKDFRTIDMDGLTHVRWRDAVHSFYVAFYKKPKRGTRLDIHLWRGEDVKPVGLRQMLFAFEGLTRLLEASKGLDDGIEPRPTKTAPPGPEFQ